MRVYLDMCALKRSYDAPSDRVTLEALAVASLVEASLAGRLEIVASAVLDEENSRNPDTARREEVRTLEGLPP